jgi:hypothetical protein
VLPLGRGQQQKTRDFSRVFLRTQFEDQASSMLRNIQAFFS